MDAIQDQELKKVRFLSDLDPENTEYDMHNEKYKDDRIFDHINIFQDLNSDEEQEFSPVRMKKKESVGSHLEHEEDAIPKAEDIIQKHVERFAHLFDNNLS